MRAADASLHLLSQKAAHVRREVVRLTHIAGSGHYGSAFSCVELLVALYYGGLLNVRPDDPEWPDRDRFLMGKGHAAIALYPILADLGYFNSELLDSYTRLGSKFGDHPDMRKVPGCDFSSGSIGHNLAVAIGMCLHLRLAASPARVVCLMGDGEQAEGEVWEAAEAAAAFGLGNVIGIVDCNGVGSDGSLPETMSPDALSRKWTAFGWNVVTLGNGHDIPLTMEAIRRALSGSAPHGRPSMIIARTVAGKGVGFMEGTWQWHLGYLGPADERRVLSQLGQECPTGTQR